MMVRIDFCAVNFKVKLIPIIFAYSIYSKYLTEICCLCSDLFVRINSKNFKAKTYTAFDYALEIAKL